MGELSIAMHLPADIPTSPHRTYAGEGWRGMGDWLGTGRIPTCERKYRSFKDARHFARSFKLKSFKEWTMFRRGDLPEVGTLPTDIPTNPNRTYADKGWSGWGDWLGGGHVSTLRRAFKSFSQVRAFVRKLNIDGISEWKLYAKTKRPDYIPSNPNQVYLRKGWTTWADWLGADHKRKAKQRR